MNDTYEPEPDPVAPRLPSADAVIVRRDMDDLHSALAAELFVHAQNCVRQFGDFHLALSGGSTPLPLYRRLMVDPAYRAMPWKFTHLWIVDERRVPFSDDKSNFRHIKELIADHADIPEKNVHPMLAMEDNADDLYEASLRECLAWREKGQDRLDYVLLGMGPDGHTASLFPGSPAIDAKNRLVVMNKGPKVTPPDRVTMTYTLINASRYISVLAAGENKKPKIAELAAGKSSITDLPIAGIKPIGGVLKWYIDAAACP